MARKRWVDGVLRVYSRWYAEGNFDISIFDSKKAIVDWYDSIEWKYPHKEAEELLINIIKENNLKNVVSFGAGSCGMEYNIKKAMPELNIVATDYETRLMNQINPFFDEMTCTPFDFYKNDVGELKERVGVDFDFAYFSASAYSMDEAHFVEMFRRLNECGIHHVVDLSGGVVPHKRFFGQFLYRLSNATHYMLHEELKRDLKYVPINRPYGFGRTVPELRRLYRRAGFDIVEEPAIKGFSYVGVLKSKDFREDRI